MPPAALAAIPALAAVASTAVTAAKGSPGSSTGTAPQLGPVDMNAANRQMGPGFAQFLNQMQGTNQQIGSARGALGQVGALQGQQQDLANYLSRQAMGTGGPTAAQSQFQSGLDQNLAGAMALGQSQAGVSPGAAMRGILEQQGRTTGQASSEAAALRAREQQSAQQQLGGVYGQMGQQALGAAGQYQGLGGLQAQLANMGIGMSEADREAAMRMQQLQSGQGLGVAQLSQQQGQFNQEQLNRLLGGLTSGFGAAATQFGTMANQPSQYTPPPPGGSEPYSVSKGGMITRRGPVKMSDGGRVTEEQYNVARFTGNDDVIHRYQQQQQQDTLMQQAQMQIAARQAAGASNQSLLDLMAGRLTAPSEAPGQPADIANQISTGANKMAVSTGPGPQLLRDIFPSGGNAFYNPGGANAGDFMSNFSRQQGLNSALGQGGGGGGGLVSAALGLNPTTYNPGSNTGLSPSVAAMAPSLGNNPQGGPGGLATSLLNQMPAGQGPGGLIGGLLSQLPGQSSANSTPALPTRAAATPSAALLAHLLAHGAEVPGKAKIDGDSESNDHVPALLSPGEIVLPRSVTQSPNADERAKAFVAAIKRHKASQTPSKGYGRVLAKRREAARKGA